MSASDLDTAHLRLRLFDPHDVATLDRLYGNPRVMRYLQHGASSVTNAPEDAGHAVHHFLDHWDAYGFGVWAVEEKATGALIGWCGLHYLPGSAEAELAYVLDEPYWHRGLATEAAHASVRDGFERVGLQRIVAVVDAKNVASCRVLEKVGLVAERTDRMDDRDVVLYAVTRPTPPRPVSEM